MNQNFEETKQAAQIDMEREAETSTMPIYDVYTPEQLSMIAIMPFNGLRHRLISRMSPDQVHFLNLMVAADPSNKIAPPEDRSALSMLAVSLLTEPMPDKVAKKIDNFLHDGSVDLPTEHNFENRMHLVHANRRPRTTIR